jgi:flagellar hook-length control protein FliK
MDTYTASAQAKLHNASTAANSAGAAQNAKTGSTDFMDMIVAQVSAQRALAREQDAAAASARRQEQQQEQQDQAQEARARNARRQENAHRSSDSGNTNKAKSSDDASKTKSTDTAKPAGDSDQDTQEAQAQSQAQNQADAAQQAADGDTSTLPTDLQKLLEEIAAQLQTTKQNSPFATREAEADASQATGQELTGTAQNAQTLALLSPEGKQKLLAALQSLMNGLPASSRPTVETLEKGVLKTLDSNNLVADAADADTTADGTSALIVSGLTPQQLTDLMKKLQDGDQKDATLSAGNFMINLVQLTPVVDAKKDAALFQPRGSILTAAQTQMTAQAAAGAAKGGATDGSKDKDAQNFQLTALLSQPGAGGTSGANATPATGFDHILRMLELARQDGGGHIANTDRADAKTSDLAAGNSVLPTALPAAGDITDSFTVDSIFPDGIGLGTSTGGYSYSSVVSVGLSTGAASMTSLTTAAPQAIYAHPAAQEVAATLVKQAGEGDSTAMTLRLDPPELGKVAVKLEFTDKDKSVKAVISADKPETYMMLQRDAHVLHNALQDAGLDVGQNGLTFQLSQDGSAFGQQNRGNQNGSAYQPSGGDAMDVAIETTMDWSVDASGAWHYNVLA